MNFNLQKKLVETASCKRGKKRNPPTVFSPVCRPTPTRQTKRKHFLSLSACFWHSNEMKKAVRSDVKTCRYFLQTAAVGVTKPTSQQTLGGRPPPYGKLGKSLSSSQSAKRAALLSFTI